MAKESLSFKKLVAHLKEILANATCEGTYEEEPDRFYGKVDLNDAGDEALISFVDEARKDKIIASQVSKRVLTDAIWQFIPKIQLKGSLSDALLEDRIKELLKTLHSLVHEWKIFVPVDNLVLKIPSELRIGNVVFHQYDALEPSLKCELDRMIDRTKESDEKKVEYKAFNCRLLSEQFDSSHVTAEVVIRAEESYAYALAEREVETALDLLLCYTHLLFSRNLKPFIGLRGAVTGATRPAIILSTKGKSSKFSMSAVGLLGKYEITEDNLKHLVDNCYFDELSKILAKHEKDRNDLEQAIVRAIRWIGRGIIADDIPEQVLSFTIALESLLTPDSKRGDIADRGARRAAFLLGKDAKSRKTVYDDFKELYSLRSDVAHAKSTDISTRNVSRLEDLAVSTLLTMTRHLDEWKSMQEFIDWSIEKQFS